MRIDIVTLFPELCDTFLQASILGRARAKGLFESHCHQIRDYTLNKQKQTDDYPYGGGCGMVLYAQPVADCLRAVQSQCAAQGRAKPHIVFLTAAGATYSEETAKRLAGYDAVTLVCGHYEGIDERVIEAFADEEISIGDYVLTGGELASLVVADSVLRLQPGVLAEEQGFQEESYWDGLIEYPQYTRPAVWEGREIPSVLLTGDHAKIEAWRSAQSRTRTRERRPDLYQAWCENHPIAVAPRLKRGESVTLVKNDEQLKEAAGIYTESWLDGYAQGSTPEFLAGHGQEAMYAELAENRKNGWAFYLHRTGKAADGLVGVNHKTGEIGRLYILPKAQGHGLGTKLLDFARRKLPEWQNPWLTTLDDNLRAMALYTRMGFRRGEVVYSFTERETTKKNLHEVKFVYTAQENDAKDKNAE